MAPTDGAAMLTRIIATVFAALTMTATPVLAEDWPTRAVTMVVPYAPGGPADVIGRIVASGMSESLGQPVVVENVAGAGGVTGANRVARATPDGYQFLLGPGGVMAQSLGLYKQPPFDPTTDFAPIGLFATAPPILIVRKDFPADNLKDFIAYLRANQSKLQFGSAGVGSGPYVTCVLLNAAIGVAVVHVPYRSSSLAEQDMIAGRIDYFCDFISTALPQIEAKTVKPIATLTPERTAMLPDLPTADEQGLAGFDASGWYAMFAAKGTPDAIVRRLNKAMSDALDSAPVRERLTKLGNTVVPPQQRTTGYFVPFLKAEIAKWNGAMKATGLSLD
jgi:tripartite-type tricarboxylate transporter receptor subunit TctC